MKMKKIISALTVAVLLIGTLGISSFAAESAEAQSAEVYVTIADKGELVMTQRRITVTDADGDGALTVNDALYLAHEAAYVGGAAAGYGSADMGWGLGITVLWGDKSGNFGYYVNNASANGLSDTVKTGDRITAFIYKDSTGYSDVYSWFDSSTLSVSENESITLELSYSYLDANNNWAITVAKLGGATVTVNGEATEYKTDADGKVTFTLTKAGTYVISATSDEKTIVPPVCTVSVTAPDGGTNSADTDDDADGNNYVPIIIVSAVAVAAVACVAAYLVVKRKKK